MNKKQMNKDIYELSKTLYGAERFKLLLDYWNEFEKTGRDFAELPLIHSTFEKKDELESYKSIFLDFVAINSFVLPKMKDAFKVILLSLSLGKADFELGKRRSGEVASRYFSNACAIFFAGVETISERNEKYSYDLLSHNGRIDLDRYLDFFDFTEKFSKPTEEEMVEDKEMFSLMIREVHTIADLGSKQ